jgi:hypothetical protein
LADEIEVVVAVDTSKAVRQLKNFESVTGNTLANVLRAAKVAGGEIQDALNFQAVGEQITAVGDRFQNAFVGMAASSDIKQQMETNIRVSDVYAARQIQNVEATEATRTRVADRSAAQQISRGEKKLADETRVANYIAAKQIAAQEEADARVLKSSQDRNAGEIQSSETARSNELKGLRTFMTQKAAEEDKTAAATTDRQNQAYAANKANLSAEKEADTARIAANRSWAQGAFAADKYAVSVKDLSLTNLPRLRYALYDVANGAQQISTKLNAMTVATISASAQYETAFTSVERTTQATGKELENLRQDLIGLTRDIPVTFADIAEIGSLGAQLGVATENIAAFASTVSKFSAVTNVTTESAAMSFGALGTLLSVSADQYENLGSAIAFAGVQAVATESEILSVSTQIGGVSAQAGLSAQYVVGLATALASLRVPAEQSRGAMTRIFQEVNRSSASGGVALQNFADVLGVTSEEAKNLASTNMEEFFNKFITGLSGMDSSQLTLTLDKLSLSDQRVTNVLSRLAGNLDVVSQSLGDASSGFASGTFLSEAYGKKADDLASRLTILSTSVQTLLASIGSSIGAANGPVTVIVDILAQMAEAITAITETTLGKILAGAVIGLIALVGAIAAFVAIAAIGGAGVAALRTAFGELVVSGIAGDKALTGFIGKLLLVDVAATRTTGVVTGLEKGLNKAQIKALKLSGGADEVARGFSNGELAAKAFGTALKGALIGGAILLVIQGISMAVTAIGDAMKSAEDRATEYYGATTSLMDAAKKDTEELANGTQSYLDIWRTTQIDKVDLSPEDSEIQRIKDASQAAAGATGNINDFASSQEGLGTSTKAATKIVDSQTISFGNNAKAAALAVIQNKILSDSEDPIAKIFADTGQQSALEKVGFDLASYTSALLAGSAGVSARAVEEAKLKLALSANSDAVMTLIKANETAIGQDFITNNEKLALLQAESSQLIGLSGNIKEYAKNTEGMVSASESQAAGARGVTDELTLQQEQLDATAEAADNFKNQMLEATDKLFDSANASAATQDALTALGDALANGGSAAAVFGGTLQAAIRAVISEDPQLAAGKLQYLLDYIMANVPQAASTISLLQQRIAQLGGGKTVAAIPFDISGFVASAKKVSSSAGGAAKAIRTLSDYASDLSKVFDRAFDIRFSGQSAADKVTSTFADMAENAQNAREEIEKTNQSINSLNADIQGLAADRALQEYFLTVAEAYGDALSAQKIRANMAKIDADIADKKSDLIKENKTLAKAQESASKTLVGNSTAAIANRSQITGLIADYQDQIKALADSGMSQDDLSKTAARLKSEFMAQATQLGYNSSELGIYAAAFDDVTTAINNVPRNITVNVNPDPALQALSEIAAKAASTASAVGSIGDAYAALDQKLMRRAAIEAKIVKLQGDIGRANMKNAAEAQGARYSALAVSQLTALLASDQYSSGGYTGAGGKYDVAGTVHRGEYVTPKSEVNQRTQKPYFMEQTPQYFSGGFVGGNNAGGGMVSLSPEDRALLRNVGGSGNIVLYADGKELARSVNDGNRQIVASGGRP